MAEFRPEEPNDIDRELEQLLEGATRVHARVAKEVGFSYSMSISPGELDEFNAAASARGMLLSDFILAAARAAMYNDVDLDRAWLIGNVRVKANELKIAIDRLAHKLPPSSQE